MPQLHNAENLLKCYSDIDIVISCGDMPPYYLDFISTIMGVPLFYVRGNHDESYSETPPGGVNLHRQVLEYGGLTMAGLEGSIRYNRGLIQYTQGQMWRMMLSMLPAIAWQRLRHGRGIDLFVVHSPALGIHDGPDYAHRGFSSFLTLLRWVKPRYMLHGHVHIWDRRKTVRTRYASTNVLNINPFTVLELEPL